ncbi:unnamed protein product, partial [Brassica oleracea var. botrytis]
ISTISIISTISNFFKERERERERKRERKREKAHLSSSPEQPCAVITFSLSPPSSATKGHHRVPLVETKP